MLDVIIGRHTWNCQIRTHIHTGYTHTRTHTQKKVERTNEKVERTNERTNDLILCLTLSSADKHEIDKYARSILRARYINDHDIRMSQCLGQEVCMCC